MNQLNLADAATGVSDRPAAGQAEVIPPQDITVGGKRTRRKAPGTAVAKAALASPPVPAASPAEDGGFTALIRLVDRGMSDPNFDVAKFEKLLEMVERTRERQEKERARLAFVEALAAFKTEPPTLIKNKKASFDHSDGKGKTEYDYATLDLVVGAIVPALSRHGLTHRWETTQETGGLVKVSCHLMHRLGHKESVTLQAGLDGSGKKNPIQQMASTVSYLERYTLLAITGLAAKGMDDDANFISPGDSISPEQKEQLIDLMREVNADTGKYLKYLKVASLDDLPTSRFNEAKLALEEKRQKKKGPGK